MLQGPNELPLPLSPLRQLFQGPSADLAAGLGCAPWPVLLQHDGGVVAAGRL